MGEKLKDNIEAIMLLAKHEKKIAELYGSYKVKFPKKKELWEGLEREEKKHASRLEILASSLEEKGIMPEKANINSLLVESSMSFIEKEKEKAERAEIKLKYALNTAKIIEASFFEKNIFELIDSGSSLTKDTLRILQKETQNHYNLLTKILEEENKEEQQAPSSKNKAEEDKITEDEYIEPQKPETVEIPEVEKVPEIAENVEDEEDDEEWV